jgi:glycosyltransferase involved in cell wall biosynthesis
MSKKNILILTSQIPYPLSDGGRISQFAFVDYLRKFFDTRYLLVANNEEDVKDIEQLKNRWTDVEIEYVETFERTVPVKKTLKERLAGSLIKNCTKIIKKTFSYYPNRIVSSSKEDASIGDLLHSVELFQPVYHKYLSKLEEVIAAFSPDMIQVEQIPFMNIIEFIPKNIKTVYVHHELRFARLQSINATGKLSENYKDYVVNLAKAAEASLLKNYDSILVFSQDDKHKLESLELNNIYNSPFPVLDSEFNDINESDFSLDKLIFWGSDNHHPNLDAVLWYAAEIGGKVKEKLGIDLTVTGSWSEDNRREIEKFGNVQFSGFVDDINEFSRNSLMIVPVRIGSGIRTKILYGMAQGLPVVSASIGAEGIPAENNKEIVIVDDADKFANAIIELFSNKNKALALAKGGQQFVQNNYSQKVLGEKRREIYQEILI